MRRYTKPIHVTKPKARHSDGSALALINVVFLLLMFLLVAGTLRPPLPEDFAWAETRVDSGDGDIQGSLVLARSGDIWFGGQPLDAAAVDALLQEIVSTTDSLSVQVDKRTGMDTVAALADRLAEAGVKHLTLVTIETDRP